MAKDDEFIRDLERQGEAAVRTRLGRNEYTSHKSQVTAWLHQKDIDRKRVADQRGDRVLAAAERSAAASERSAEAAHKASNAAVRSSRWTIWAVVVALVSVIVAVAAILYKL